MNSRQIAELHSYDPKQLLTWESFLFFRKTIWFNPTLWFMLLRLTIMSLVVAVIFLLTVKDPVTLRTEKFIKISTFLNAFVGVLMGFFVMTSMNHWYACAMGFMEISDAVLNLQMQLYALGVPEDKVHLVLRYGTLSMYLIAIKMHAEVLPEVEKEDARNRMWDDLVVEGSHVDEALVPRFNVMYLKEREILQCVSDPSGEMWTWVSSLIGRMAQDALIPPMASPTYGRILNLVQNAHAGVRQAYGSVSVQSPFMYTHMMACLVHINNVISAISFGFILGTGISVLLIHQDIHPLPDSHSAEVRNSHVARDFQNVVVSFFICMFGPFIYQAILQVAIALAQPFASEEGKVPTASLLQKLSKDLEDGVTMNRAAPWWDPPSFRGSGK